MKCDVLLALHARKSHTSIARFRKAYPERPLLVALTGTDLYDDVPKGNPKAMRSLELADRLITLHPLAVKAVPAKWRKKVVTIYQSVSLSPLSKSPPAIWKKYLKQCRAVGCLAPVPVVVIGHLREVKDPLRSAYAARELPPDSKVHILHLGAATTPEWKRLAEDEMKTNPRYHWLGSVSHRTALSVLKHSNLLCLTSRLEGGANVIMEAIALGKPILSSRIDGSLGLLGVDYPAYFPVGDTVALRKLLIRFETDERFRKQLSWFIERNEEKTKVDGERKRLRDAITMVDSKASRGFA